jgi:hypothetical protein
MSAEKQIDVSSGVVATTLANGIQYAVSKAKNEEELRIGVKHSVFLSLDLPKLPHDER